jgi:mannose-1-phosphate guanylyltransferase
LTKPLLVATIERLKNHGFSRVLVNCHHLREQIVEVTKSIEGVEIQEEPVILGTGGALGLAARTVDDTPLLVSNSDIYHDADYRKLYDYHISSGNRATLLLHPCPRFNSIRAADGQITHFRLPNKDPGLFAYTGVQVIDPELIETLSPDTFSCIIEHYEALLGRGVPIGCYLEPDLQWYDIGTPEDYLGLHKDLLTGRIPTWRELGHSQDTTYAVDPEARCDPSSEFREWVSIGKADIGSGALVCRSVIWDGARVEPGSSISDRIIIPS